MCAQLGMGELVIILLIVVVVFGAGKLPQIGDAMGRSVKNFKKAFNSTDEIEVTPKKELADAKPTDASAVEVKAEVTKQS